MDATQNVEDRTQNVEVPPPYVTAAPVLPNGWEAQMDANGRRFYVDHNTKQTHWTLPTDIAAQQQQQQQQQQHQHQHQHHHQQQQQNPMVPQVATSHQPQAQYPPATDRQPLIGQTVVQMGGLGNNKYPLFPPRPSPASPFSDSCCRCFCPLLAIVGTQGCLDQNDILVPCCLGMCVPCGDSCFAAFMWQPKNALAHGVKVEDTFNFLSCPMKCFCPVYAVAGQQGCVDRQDMWCACCLGWMYTQCCWNPKTRDAVLRP